MSDDAYRFATAGGLRSAHELTAGELVDLLDRLAGKPEVELVRAELIRRLSLDAQRRYGRRYQRVDRAELVSLVHVVSLRGAGTERDPVRLIHQYWSPEGELLAERDMGASVLEVRP